MTSRWMCMLIFVVLLKPVVAVAADRSAASRPSTAPAPQEFNAVTEAFLKPAEVVAGDDALRQKLKERHNTLLHILQLRVQGYRKGLNDAAPIYDAVEMVAEAKMDLAQNDQEREAAAQHLLDVTKVVEERAEKQLKAGFGSEVDVDRAKVLRENAEIQLLKLKGHQASPATQPR